jgi:DUF4097 and DUF4098 domain-containing protein YvlB
MSSRRFHRRATTAGLVAIATAGLCTAGAAQGQLREERKESRRLQFSGQGQRTLDVRALNGTIRVTGDGGADVRLEATLAFDAETRDALSAAQKNVTIEGREEGTNITIAVRDAGTPTCGEQGDWRQPAWWDRRRYDAEATLTIQVPRDVRVRLCTVNGGEAVLDGTQGDFDVSNVNGRIVLKGMRGSGRASTVNGTIDAAFDAAPRAESLFKTVNGDIAVTLPRDLAADLRVKTFRGGIYTDFETVEQPAEREPSRRPGQPRFVYRRRGFTDYRVGKGGPELTFETLNGDVRIQRGAR